MIEKFGLKGTEKDSIFFSESSPEQITTLKHIKVEISRQNANLAEVKIEMAKEAKLVNANAIVNFKYGQKAHSGWDKFISFKWDTESWHGEGDAVSL